MVQVDQLRFRQCVDVDHDECPDVRRSGPLGHGRWWAGSGQGTVAGQWLDYWSPAFGEVCEEIVTTGCSEGRRVGNEWVSKGRFRWSSYHLKKPKKKK